MPRSFLLRSASRGSSASRFGAIPIKHKPIERKEGGSPFVVLREGWFFSSHSRCTTSLLRSSTRSFPAGKERRKAALPAAAVSISSVVASVRKSLSRMTPVRSRCVSVPSFLSFSVFISFSRTRDSRIVNSEAPTAQGTRRKRVPFFFYGMLARAYNDDNQLPPLPSGFTCKSTPKLATRPPESAKSQRGSPLRSKHAIAFQGSSRVFYPTFVMPLPAGSYTSGSTYHVCNGCFTASRALVRTELLMDPPRGWRHAGGPRPADYFSSRS